MCDMTHSLASSCSRNEWRVSQTQSYVRCDPTIRATWRIRMCDMTNPVCDKTQPHVRHDSFMYVAWLSHICDTTHGPELIPAHTVMHEIFYSDIIEDISIMTWPSKNRRSGEEFGSPILDFGEAFFFAGLSCWAFCGAEPCKRSPCKKPRKRNRARIPGFSWNLWLVPCHYPALIVNAMGGILVRQHSFRNNLEILWHPIYFWLHVYI